MKTVKLEDIKLCPLRVPTGWIVVKNHFLELAPQEALEVMGVFENNPWHLFTQDLLQMTHQNYSFTIDLGWYPEASPDGAYQAVLIKDDAWDTPYRKLESTSLSEVRTTLEKWMEELASGFGLISPRF